VGSKLIKVSEYTYQQLEDIKKREEHKSFDSVIRSLVLEHYSILRLKKQGVLV